MTRFLHIILLILVPLCAFSQFEEHFTDGGFNVNPHWDTLGTNFIVVNQVLNLQASNNTGNAAIMTADTLGKSVEWSLYLRLGFQPSDNDKLDVVLMSNQMDIRNDFDGYFVRIGQNGNTDALDFYRKDGNSNVLIKSMLAGNFQNGADGNLKVVKNNLGKWVFYWKEANQSSYVALDSTQELTYASTTHFGMLCTYTAASKDSFWFDDVYCIQRPLLSLDVTPPSVSTVSLINSTQVDIYFDETVDITSAQLINNYTLSSLGNPMTAVIDALNKKLVHLTFAQRFLSNTTYTLTTNNVADSAGNSMSIPNISNFNTPYYAVLNDILINEIMIKPSTALGLPNKQYIELKNTSNENISLKNFTINNANVLEGTIAANTYAILCAAADTNLFKPFGNTIALDNWNNLAFSGTLTLRADDTILIDQLNYVDTMYHDVIKQNGGWSLELLSSAYTGDCDKELFWSASVDVNGGTPGEMNRNEAPEYVHATFTLINNTTIEVDFTKPMDKTSAQSISNYQIDNGISIQNIMLANTYASKVTLTLASALQPNIIYTFTVAGFSGCVKYIHLADTFDIAITEIPTNGELIINEILFHADAGVEQFVELYNNSSKLFKISDIKIAQANPKTEIEEQLLDLSNTDGYIFANDYIVFTKNKISIKSQYPQAILEKMKDVNLPTFDTQEDIVLLKNRNDEVLDKLHYQTSWHFPLLKTTKGVSLEKSGFDLPQNKRYWHSAAESAGFATPTYLNSENEYHLLGNVHIIPEVFSPDGDGYDDEAKITYSFDEDGSVVNVYLYNAAGQLANHLVKDEAIAKEGAFVWNGDDENGSKKDVGIYFLVFERKKPDGEKIIYKRKCVLAAKLN